MLLVAPQIGMAEEGEDAGKSKGYLTGSFESTSNYYHEDAKTNATVPDGKFGSNNYVKLDYYNNRFSAGVQMEAYAPVLVGYSHELKGINLTNYYVSWRDDSFSVTAGTFYEQFGSGLLFRSWEAELTISALPSATSIRVHLLRQPDFAGVTPYTRWEAPGSPARTIRA